MVFFQRQPPLVLPLVFYQIRKWTLQKVTTLAAAVFDDVRYRFAIVLGIVTVMESSSGGSLDGKVIGLIALKALVFGLLYDSRLVFSNK